MCLTWSSHILHIRDKLLITRVVKKVLHGNQAVEDDKEDQGSTR